MRPEAFQLRTGEGDPLSSGNRGFKSATIARTVLEDICDKPIRIQSYCAVARLHGV
jgi:hypothetical protein